MTFRTRSHWAVPPLALLALVATISCTASEDDADSSAPSSTSPPELCVRFPARDATVMLEAPEDPRLAEDPEFTDSLLEVGAKGLDEGAPAAIKAQVDTYVAALRDYQPGVDPMDDPKTAAAVADINAWLQANCGPPTATIPPDTGPPGTTS